MSVGGALRTEKDLSKEYDSPRVEEHYSAVMADPFLRYPGTLSFSLYDALRISISFI
jgi:hypothetical protein